MNNSHHLRTFLRGFATTYFPQNRINVIKS